MPLKPGKDESQSDFMARCMHELSQGDNDKRPQDQKVAICMGYWRDEKGGEKPDKSMTAIGMVTKQDCPEPEDDESRDDYLDRCVEQLTGDDDEVDEDDAADACAQKWEDAAGERGARARPKPQVPVFHKSHVGTVSGMEFILSDETVDRMGDVISSDGWDIANFKRNPIALFNHRADFPIGKWQNLRVEKGALRGHLKLAPEGTSPRIDEIRKLIEAGILQAVSVGFKPIESKPRKAKDAKGGIEIFSGGEIFTKQELIETSLVSVPANPNALAVAKSLNVSPETMDLIFGKHANRDQMQRRDLPTGKNAETSRRNERGQTMSLAQRITDIQTQIGNKTAELEAHLANQNDSNVSDSDLEKTTLLNGQISQLQKQHEALTEAEKRIAGNLAKNGNGQDNGNRGSLTVIHDQRSNGIGAPMVVKHSKKDWEPLDYLVHAGVATAFAKLWNVTAEHARLKIYGEDEAHKVVHEWTQRAATAPAMTTVPTWAQELVQQVYTSMLDLLMPKSVFPRLSAKGLSLSFGRAGKIILPLRQRTPTIAGSFVGEGMAIPVRQGAFTSTTFTPKKMAVITVWTKEMDDHSIPAIEGVLRQAIQEDTAIALDSVLLDANVATVIRPAGILNGATTQAGNSSGTTSLDKLVADIKYLVGTLTTASYGNLRNLVLLMNPSDMLSASFVSAANTGIFPFKDEIARGTLANIPIIDSATVPPKTVILVDAADFVTMQGDAMRMEMSDQATLHMEDTTPTDLVGGGGTPGAVATPQRSLFQTDSLALRMIFPVNWALRRSGMVAYVTNIQW